MSDFELPKGREPRVFTSNHNCHALETNQTFTWCQFMIVFSHGPFDYLLKSPLWGTFLNMCTF